MGWGLDLLKVSRAGKRSSGKKVNCHIAMGDGSKGGEGRGLPHAQKKPLVEKGKETCRTSSAMKDIYSNSREQNKRRGGKSIYA